MKTFDYASDPPQEAAPFPSGKHNGKSLGQWNAWCAAATESQQPERLAQVPEVLRDQVRRHLDTVRAIRGYYERKGRLK